MVHPHGSDSQITIRQLQPSERGHFRNHLIRLDRLSRAERFNGACSDEFLNRYADRCFDDGAVIIGALHGENVLGAAELHEYPDHIIPTGEIALSVEAEFQRHGYGGSLFRRAISHARALGYRQLRITTQSQNSAMKNLARNFSAKLESEDGETIGTIRLDEGARDRDT